MKYLLIDGNNLIHRTHHTAEHQAKLNDFTEEMCNNNHVFFTLNSILSYTKLYSPTRIYIAWDERKGSKEKSHRRELLEDYKGNRTGDIRPHRNNDVIREMTKLLGIQSLYPLNLEADDVIAYVAREIPGKKVIASVDKDFLQLVNKDTVLFDTIRKKEYNNDNFEELTGKNQDDWYTAKCITGDKSDNVPGIKGWGKVKVRKHLAGELDLNDKEKLIVEQNHEIFRLDKYNDYADEKEFYRRQLELEVKGSYKKFIEKCEELGYNSILKKKEDWNNAFFFKTKLLDIFS